MGNGLVRAALATIATRSYTVEGKPLAGADIVKMYEAMGSMDPSAPCRAVGACGQSDRRFDRAIQTLKRAGLVRFEGGRWMRTGDTATEGVGDA